MNALPDDPEERERLVIAIRAVNQKNSGKNLEVSELAPAIMRGVTIRPSGKWVSFACHNPLLLCYNLCDVNCFVSARKPSYSERNYITLAGHDTLEYSTPAKRQLLHTTSHEKFSKKRKTMSTFLKRS